MKQFFYFLKVDRSCVYEKKRLRKKKLVYCILRSYMMFVLVKTQSNGLLGVLEKASVNDTSLYNNRFGIRLCGRVS
jgi:hypothetical protein